jgi:hypothetical protein
MHVYERDLRPAPKAAANFVSEVMDGWKAVFYYDREVAKNTMKVKKSGVVFSYSLDDLKAELCNGEGPYCDNFWGNDAADDEKIAAYEKQVTEWDGKRKLVIFGHESLDSGGAVRAELIPVRFVSKVIWEEE